MDKTTSREKRDLDLMRELLKEKDRVIAERERSHDKREKEIRNDMKQLAASKARVAALQQQLQDQSMLNKSGSNRYPIWSSTGD